MSNSFVTTIGRQSFKINTADEHQAIIDGVAYSYSFTKIQDDRYSLILNGKCFEIVASIPKNGAPANNREFVISVNGIPSIAQVDDEKTHELRSLFSRSSDNSSNQIVRAPMPGLIARLEVEVGEKVVPGKGLLVLEAMKMENEIRSMVKGRVTKICVEKGRVVEKGESLVIIGGD